MLAVLVAATAAPYLVLGPGFYRDDWDSLAAARFDGLWATAGELVAQRRPLGALTYSIVFPLTGDDPRIGAGLLVLAGLAVPLLLVRLLRCWLPAGVALAVAATWVVLPSHSSLTRWISTVNIVVAAAVLLAGLLVLVRAQRAGREGWWGLVLVVASTLFYDGTMVAAAAGLLAVPALDGRRVLRPSVLVGLPVLALRGGWAIVAADRAERPTEMIDLAAFYQSNFGWGVLAWRPAWLALSLAVLTGVLVVLWWSVRQVLAARAEGRAPLGGLRPDAELLVVAGLAVLVVGILPFLPTGYLMDFVGVGDRANVIASMGAAMVLVGLVRCIPWPADRPAAPVVALAVLLVAMVPLRLRQDVAWRDSWVWAQRVLDEVEVASDGGTRRVVAWPPVGIEGAHSLTGDGSTALATWMGVEDVTFLFLPEDADVPEDLVRIDTEPHRP